MSNESENRPMAGNEEPVDEQFVRRVVTALIRDRRRRRRVRLVAAGALLFFFFAGAGQRAFTAATTSADETYAGLVAPSTLDGLLPD